MSTQPPVFVVGSGRCGSTALSQVLAYHPQVLSLSELFSSSDPFPLRAVELTGEAPAVAPRTRTGGATIWLTGLPSAGKTTIALALAERLRAKGRRVEVLDGDGIRTSLSADLGFSREDRYTNVTRIGFAAELLASHGILVLAPVIAPYADSRAAVAARHDERGTPYLEVHVATPVEVCAERDVKGLYAKQKAGELSGLTGVDAPYEAPDAPDLRIHTHTQSVADSAGALLALLSEKGLV